MDFTWHPRKRRENLRKHGIDFVDVVPVFERLHLVRRDDREDYGEDRWVTMGYLKDVLIVVVYTEEHDGAVHFISAREATRHEAKAFHRKRGF
jgi:uncharacterized DUF497 family protein